MTDIKSYFIKVDTRNSTCKICNKVVKTSGNTTNLKVHLKNNHFDAALKCKLVSASEPQAAKKRKHGESTDATDALVIQPTIDQSFSTAASMTEHGSKWNEVTADLIYMICKDNMPVRCVEKCGLRKYSTHIKNYKLPSRSMVTSLIEDKYTNTVETVTKRFEKVANFAFTCDLVTITNSSRGFMTITAHYIESNKLDSICLAAVRIANTHTANNITKLFEESVAKFKIPKAKWLSLTTDHHTAMIAATSSIIGANHHIGCMAHALNLVVDKSLQGFKHFTDVLGEIKAIVKYFKQSTTAMDELRAMQRADGIPEGSVNTLVQNIETRWNSCLEMMVAFIKLHNIVAAVLLKRSQAKCTRLGCPEMISPSKLSLTRDLINVLQPFKEATENISGEKFVTASLVLPLTALLNRCLQRAVVVTDLGEEAKKIFVKETASRFKEIEKNNILAKATLLDPRFKKMYFQSALTVATKITQLKVEVEADTLPTTEPNQQEQAEVTSVEQSCAESRSLWADHIVEEGPLENSFDSELKNYFNMPNINKDSDPITYWQTQKHIMPNLYKLAMKYLIAPGSSVPSERLASAIKLVCSDNRSRMTDDHIQQRVFLKSLNQQFW